MSLQSTGVGLLQGPAGLDLDLLRQHGVIDGIPGLRSVQPAPKGCRGLRALVVCAVIVGSHGQRHRSNGEAL
jgi:hypothetical protein